MKLVTDWLAWDCREFASRCRARAYLANPLLRPDGYSETWHQKGCDCPCSSVCDTEGFVDPVTDEAPWFDPAHPESADGLGVEVIRVSGLDTTQLNDTDREVTIRGLLYANSCEGMTWMRRWLQGIVMANETYCEGSVLQLVEDCEPLTMIELIDVKTTNLDLSERYDSNPDRCCIVQPFTLTVTAANRMFRPVTEILEPTAMDDCGAVLAAHASFQTSRWVHTLAPKIVIEAGCDNHENLHVYVATRYCDQECPTPVGRPQSYKIAFRLDLEAGRRIVIDSQTRDVYWRSRNGQRAGSAWTALKAWNGVMRPFHDYGPGSDMCVTVYGNPATLGSEAPIVSIEAAEAYTLTC